MSSARVFRCGTCGAPLEGIADARVVRCTYCHGENRIDPAPAAPPPAAGGYAPFGRAPAPVDDHEARSEALLAEFEREQERALMEGDAEAARRAVEHFEGYLRLQYAPTIQLYTQMAPNDPQVLAALQQIDATVDQSVRSIAESLGVEYRTAEQRVRGR
jgi:hypothetical protein